MMCSAALSHALGGLQGHLHQFVWMVSGKSRHVRPGFQVSVGVWFLGIVLHFFVPVAQAVELASHFISSMRGTNRTLGAPLAGSIYATLLDHSKKMEPWQQDALRRHTLSPTLPNESIVELMNIAYETMLAAELALEEDEGGETTFENPEVVPLAPIHIPSNSAVAPPVTLRNIQHIQGVNRLLAGTDITLKPSGLNIIFGLNGVGKSGYTRILKSCCHSKSREAIMGNVFDAATVAPRAKISYLVGDNEEAHEWNPSEDSDNADLSRVAVYDSKTAAVHVGKTPTDLSYTPLGLELITGLIGTYDAVANEARNKIAWFRGHPAPSIVAEATSPTVRKSMNALGKAGGFAIAQTISLLAEEETNQLRSLPGEILNLQNNSKTARANQARLSAGNHRTQGARIKTLSRTVSTEQVTSLRTIWNRLREIEADQAVEVKHEFTTEKVPGVMTSHWQQMWDAVQEYAKSEVDLQPEYPAEDSQYCLLCHQTLSPEAHARLERFSEAMANDLETERIRINEQAIQILAGIRAAVSGDNIDSTLLAVLEEDHPEDIAQFRADLETIKSLLEPLPDGKGTTAEFIQTLTSPFTEGSESDQGSGIPVPGFRVANSLDQTVEFFSKLATEFDDEVAEIEGESAEGNVLAMKQATLLDLQERGRVAKYLNELKAQHNRLVHIHALEKVVGQCSTRGLTEKTRTMTADYIKRVADDFAENLRLLEELPEGVAADEFRLKVELVPAPIKKGVHSIAFTVRGASDPKQNADAVFSEGEFRAISLAAFLADVSSSDDGSAIIFDDPMNSLDHDFQSRVAIRLVEEARHRQVIIFTHSSAFVGSLWHEGIQRDRSRQLIANEPNIVDVDHHFLEIVRQGNDGTGVQVGGMGTPTNGFKGIMTFLENEIVKQARKHHSGDNANATAYHRDCETFANNLRKAWEYAVEEIIVDDVVARYKPSISTQKLKSLLKLTERDVAMVEAGMDVNSFLVHSTGLGKESTPPTPNDMQGRIKTLRDWASEYRNRKIRPH